MVVQIKFYMYVSSLFNSKARVTKSATNVIILGVGLMAYIHAFADCQCILTFMFISVLKSNDVAVCISFSYFHCN